RPRGDLERPARGARARLFRRPDPGRDLGSARRPARHGQEPDAPGAARPPPRPHGNGWGVRRRRRRSGMTEHLIAGLRCSDVTDLVPGFVLGALEPTEMTSVRAHLAACPEPHPELAELGSVVPALLA